MFYGHCIVCDMKGGRMHHLRRDMHIKCYEEYIANQPTPEEEEERQKKEFISFMRKTDPTFTLEEDEA